MQMIKTVFSILLHTLVKDREERIPGTCIHPTEEIMGPEIIQKHGRALMVNGDQKNFGL